MESQARCVCVCWTLSMDKIMTLLGELPLLGVMPRLLEWLLPLLRHHRVKLLPSRDTTARVTVLLCQSEAANAYGDCPGYPGDRCSRSRLVLSCCLSVLLSSRLPLFQVQEGSWSTQPFSNATQSFMLHPYGGSRSCFGSSIFRFLISPWFCSRILECLLASRPFLPLGG